MEPVIIYVIIGVAALALGTILGKVLFAKNTQKQVEEAEQAFFCYGGRQGKNEEPLRLAGVRRFESGGADTALGLIHEGL